MKFIIQVSNPRVCIKEDALKDIESISELIEEIFPMLNEDMILIWNFIRIPLEYKYDVSVIINDLLELLQAILAEDEGEISIAWPSNTFRSDWNVKWKGQSLSIDSEWFSIVGLTKDILNKHQKIELSTNEFLAEWKMLLSFLIKIFKEYNLLELNLEEFDIMKNLIDKIPGVGKYYKEEKCL